MYFYQIYYIEAQIRQICYILRQSPVIFMQYVNPMEESLS